MDDCVCPIYHQVTGGCLDFSGQGGIRLPETETCIGIDWGVKKTATTTSDAHDLPHIEPGKKAAGR